ncbi:acyltransferase [Caulobacter sp. BK020]|uniref:acyltransferase family protein n=1 Tax=Caulobacter sp. BK020 TaxID=2512117 RepID=UPI0014048CF8|nr:acyltransferase [Caulobacter sp. BK020]
MAEQSCLISQKLIAANAATLNGGVRLRTNLNDSAACTIAAAAADRVIVNLQFLRGIAALFVVADHLLERLVKRGAYPAEYRDLAWSLGTVGVEVFFAISGFIMVYTMADAFGRRGASIGFLIRRYLRIAPLYYLTTVAAILMTAIVKHVSPQGLDLAKSLAFIPYRNAEGLLQPVYALGWTLNYEMFFYVVFAIAMLLPLRLGLAAVLIILSSLVVAPLAGWNISSAPSQVQDILEFLTRPIILYFTLGILVAIAYRRVGRRGVALPDAVICLGVFLLLLASALWRWPHGLSIGAAIVLTTLVGALKPSPMFNALARTIGDASYSVYLTHSFLLGGLASAFARLPMRGSAWLIAYCALACVVCLTVGWLTWRHVETPLSRILRKKARPGVILAQGRPA